MSDPSKRIQDLSILHPTVRAKVSSIQTQLDAEGIPLRVFESYRTPERQNYLYAQGRTRPGGIVTYKKAWGSYHQYGLAVDFVFYENNKWNWGPEGSKKHQRWYKRLHELGAYYGLEPLGFETPHLQLVGWSSQRLEAGEMPEGGDAAWAENLLAMAENWSGSPDAPDFDGIVVADVDRPPLDEVLNAGGATANGPGLAEPSGVPSGSAKNLKSRFFAGNAALEAVASGDRLLRASGGKIEGVELLQKALNMLAVRDPAYAIETGAFAGYFGQKTERAVKAFQEDFRLVVDGTVGEETIEALDTAILTFEQSPLPQASSLPQGTAVYIPAAVNVAVLAKVKFGTADAGLAKSFSDAYATADRDPSLAKGDPSNCKALLKFPDGTVFFDAKMAICADGSPRAKDIDPGPGNPKTAFTYPGTTNEYFNAENTPYVVLPSKNPSGSLNFTGVLGISKLDLAVVIHKGKVTPAFYGEVGPWFRLGEAAIEVHENLPVRAPWTTPAKTKIRNASVEGDVLCFVFPNTAVKRTPAMSSQDWLKATLEAALLCWEAFLAKP
jgi:peptidoglycan hydrolase-like protein with peptidoglycan-binding domain